MMSGERNRCCEMKEKIFSSEPEKKREFVCEDGPEYHNMQVGKTYKGMNGAPLLSERHAWWPVFPLVEVGRTPRAVERERRPKATCVKTTRRVPEGAQPSWRRTL